MRFEFATAGRIIFGNGTLSQVGPAAREMGRRTLVVTGSDPVRAELLLAGLRNHAVEYVTFPVSEEPTTLLAREGTQVAIEAGCDLVIGFGGGSIIDAAKAVAALAANGGDPLDYLEIVGRSQPLTRTSLPVIAIPTTAGTGAEATMGAVITDPATHRKIDVVSPLMAPRLALVDPEVTVSLPPGMTAATGMDALTHSVEGYTATLAHPLTDAIHRQAIELLGKYLLRAYRDGSDRNARYHTMMASMIAGIGFPNSGLGAVHGLALPLGGHFNIAHGVANAILLPHVMAFNLPAARARLRDIAVALGAPRKSAAGAIDHVFALRRELKLPVLASFGVGEEHLDALARDALGRNSNCVTNPRPVTEADAKEIYRAALREQ